MPIRRDDLEVNAVLGRLPTEVPKRLMVMLLHVNAVTTKVKIDLY